jgi:hypothetical protein
MMKNLLYTAILAGVLVIVSCSNSNNNEGTTVTERIQYDVVIKTPDADLDWWVQNIEGMKREWLIKLILDNAGEGKVQAYDYLNTPMTADDVKNIGKRDDTLFMPSMEPPYDDSLVVISERLKISDITKIRFLEEWQINEKTLQISKKVLGMAPMRQDYSPDGEVRGFKPLFWIYFEEGYPAEE